MAHLALSLLGTFEVTLAGRPVTAFSYDKVRALLAYLAVEAARPHRRDSLTGLLWAEWPERQARQNLSQALLKLRQALGDHQVRPAHLLISSQSLQFNPAGDYELDVSTFAALLAAGQAHDQGRLAACEPCLERLEQAVALYRGDFLAGFALEDSPAFEEWALLQRERLQRLALGALTSLAGAYEARGQYQAALDHARRRLELDPWQEEAVRQMIRLLALSGQRGAALAQYDRYRRSLLAELDLEPVAQTTRLYEQIRAGEIGGGARARRRRGERFTPAPRPLCLSGAPSQTHQALPLVARERELAQLEGFLQLALAGQGRIVFVTGGPGRGKTALIEGFARRAVVAQPDLVVAGGQGSAQTGVGDPYLPFHEVLDMLTGDVEAGCAAGAIGREQCQRLWQLLPVAVQALLEVGPDLIETFLPGESLLRRAAAVSQWPAGGDWLSRLEALVERKTARPGGPHPQQSALFEQYTRLLQALAHQKPLLLLLDDLHWADHGSINLLFHLGRRLAGSRILIVGAYRPAEAALGYPLSPPFTGEAQAGQERHPLQSLVNELKRFWGEIELDLSQANHRQFVDAYLDSEPNRLDAAFRQKLFRHTDGQPLFTVELVRGLQARGDLVQDQQGRWVEGPHLDWETWPPRVKAIMAERLGRLPQPWQETLSVASVEGITFTAEVVARVQAVEEGEMVHRLSEQLGRAHRLVSAQEVRQLSPDGPRLARYRFRHRLFQKYLYQQLDQPQRSYLHQAVGTALEALYGERVAEIAGQLARHFQEAGLVEKAATYLAQDGERASRQPDTPTRAGSESRLQTGLATALPSGKG